MQSRACPNSKKVICNHCLHFQEVEGHSKMQTCGLRGRSAGRRAAAGSERGSLLPSARPRTGLPLPSPPGEPRAEGSRRLPGSPGRRKPQGREQPGWREAAPGGAARYPQASPAPSRPCGDGRGCRRPEGRGPASARPPRQARGCAPA